MAKLEEVSEEKPRPRLEPVDGTASPRLEEVDIDHRTFLDRWEHGTAMQKVMASAVKGAHEGFGSDDPRSLGFQQGSENTRWMQQIGVFANPERPALVDGLRLPMEGAIRVGAGVGDAAFRLLQAAVYSGASAFGQVAEEMGASQGNANRTKNELINFANYLMIKQAADPAPFSRTIRGSDGLVRDEKIGALPAQADFDSTARTFIRRAEYEANGLARFDERFPEAPTDARPEGSPQAKPKPKFDQATPEERMAARLDDNFSDDATKAEGSRFSLAAEERANHEARTAPPPLELPSVEDLSDKLRSLWEEYGIHPNEVLADAIKDTTLAHDLLSDRASLPERYTGYAAGNAEPAPHKDSPEHLTLEQFRKAAEDGVVGPAEPDTTTPTYRDKTGKDFKRIDRGYGVAENATEGEALEAVRGRRDSLRGVVGNHIDNGLMLGYRTEDIARHVAHRYAVEHQPGYLDATIKANAERGPRPEISEASIKAAYDDMQAARKDAGAGKEGPLIQALQKVSEWPETPEIREGMLPEPKKPWDMRLGDHISSLLDRMPMRALALLRDMQMKLTPMAERTAGMNERATAKDFAATKRMIIDQGQQIHKLLTDSFSKDRLTAMYDAVIAEDEAKMAGASPKEGTGLASLSTEERRVVDLLRERMADTYKEAGELKMHGDKTGGREFYVPLMMAAARGVTRIGEVPAGRLGQLGRNLFTTTRNLRRRKYATAEESEAAAKKALGEDAFLVRDIRTLNLANTRLQEAVAGRKLIDEIKKLNKDIGQDVVIEGAVPEHVREDYFTLDHPAFRTVKPRTEVVRGTLSRYVKDENGKQIMDSVPLNIYKSFEGPLRAVLTLTEGEAYRGFMDLKAKAMSALMLSPLMHNQVIFGRALPAGSMKVAGVPVPFVGNGISTARFYFEGNKVRNDLALRGEAIGDGGVVPMGGRGASFDVASIAEIDKMAAGRSWTARLLAIAPDLLERQSNAMAAMHGATDAAPKAGEAVKAAVDKVGVFWHEKMLWDRVADLQFGLWKNFRDDLMERKGLDQLTADRVAGHFANRYAGAIPQEAISTGMRQLLNIGLFSRSYTMTGIGAVKDMVMGLPRDVRAQIERDGGMDMLAKANSVARRKAIGIVAMDFALLYVGNSLLQSGITVLKKAWSGDTTQDKKDKATEALYEEGREYAERLDRWIKSVKDLPGGDHPFHALAPWANLGATADNEPNKDVRILTGYQSDGTAIYAKNPFGKTTEDMVGWLTHPAQMIINKSNPVLVRPLMESAFNSDYAGRHIYNPYAELPEKATRGVANIVWHTMAAAVPADVGEAVWELLHGTPTADEKTVDILKIVGPLLGYSFSKGYPGGPVMGEVAMSQKQYQYALEVTLPDARKLAKEGREDEAREKMTAASIPERYQTYIIDMAKDPSAKFAKRRTQQFIETLPQERQDAINRALERTKP